jgi:hypothetical protein
MTSDPIEYDTPATLAAVARLLTHAASLTWAQAEAEGPRSFLHSLGLGIHLAYIQALAMLPTDVDLDGHPLAQDDVRQLLRAAEEPTRSIPIVRETAGISQLVVAICDLVRETTPNRRDPRNLVERLLDAEFTTTRQVRSVRARDARPAVGHDLLGVEKGNMSHSVWWAVYLDSVAPSQARGEDG